MVYVFKTSIGDTDDKRIIRPYLDGLTEIDRWNIDLEDCDKILRIVAGNVDQNRLVEGIRLLGYECEVLE